MDGKAFQQAVHQRDYIVNKRTGKIHSTECSAVSLMSEKNKMQLSNTSLLELVKQGYIVCRKCRAGIKKDNENQNRRNHPNLYGDEIEIIASYDDYIKAIDEMGEWYSNHVPTYQRDVQIESYSDYLKKTNYYEKYVPEDFYNEYILSVPMKLSRKGYVLSKDENGNSVSLLRAESVLLKSSENAAKYFLTSKKEISFKKYLAYYPCELLSSAKRYSKPGDDCVRYVFSIFNRMDYGFVEKYELLSRMEYSKTNAFAITTDENDIAYGFLNLGFAIYDGKEHIVDVDDDTVAEGYINQIDDDFQLQKGDILAREKHVQVYLGSDDAGKSLHFGWGGVNLSYPCVSEVKIVKMSDGTNQISLINSIGETEYYTRLYRYTGTKGD